MNGFKTVITSRHKLMDLHIKETFSYKDLILLFVKRDFVSKYKQTALGPLWAVIQPLFTTVVFTIVFGNLASLPTLDKAGDYVIPGFLFYMAGNIVWSYFSSTLQGTANTFIANRGTMGKVYYPRLVAPVSTAFSNLISFGIQFVLFAVILAFYLIKGGTSIEITPRLLLLFPLMIQVMFLASGSGIIISAMTTKYRDLQMVVGFGLQLLQYLSPIAYGLTLVSEKKPELFGLYMMNPIAPVVSTFRYAVFGVGFFDPGYWLISVISTGALFFVGLILFSRIERTFMDTV